MVWSATFVDRAEVLSWLASTIKGQEAVAEADAAGPTFDELASEWLDGVHSGAVGRRRGRKGIGYSSTTLEGYERSLRYVLTPGVRRPPCERDRRPRVAAWVDRLSREGLSRSRIANHLAVARAIYGWASRPTRRLVERNPLAGIELPPNDEKPGTESPTRMRPRRSSLPDPADAVPYALAFYAGLRRAEIKRLDWPDVELDGYRLRREEGQERAGTGRRPPIAEPLRPILRREFMRQGRRENGRSSPVSVMSGKLAERARRHGRRRGSSRSRFTSAATPTRAS